jgi:hypothetical protein
MLRAFFTCQWRIMASEALDSQLLPVMRFSAILPPD